MKFFNSSIVLSMLWKFLFFHFIIILAFLIIFFRRTPALFRRDVAFVQRIFTILEEVLFFTYVVHRGHSIIT